MKFGKGKQRKNLSACVLTRLDKHTTSMFVKAKRTINLVKRIENHVEQTRKSTNDLKLDLDQG